MLSPAGAKARAWFDPTAGRYPATPLLDRRNEVRDDHLTFLVLALAVALVTFAIGGVPPLLLPPIIPSRAPRRESPPQRAGGTHGDHLEAPGALTAQERTEKPQIHGSPGAGVNMPRRPKAQGGFDSRPVANAAASGNRRPICMQTVTHRHEPPAPVVIRTRNDVAHDPTAKPRPN